MTKEVTSGPNKRHTAKQPDYTLARDILDNDFISPQEITIVRRRLTYTKDQIAEFTRTLPDRETLAWIRDNDFMLVAGPPCDMSLLEIRKLSPDYFRRKSGGWYANPFESFSREDVVSCRWLALRKTYVYDSDYKTWDEQQPLLSDIECVPNIAEVAWGLTIYKAVRKTYLFNIVSVRTSSVDSIGNHVVIGAFNQNGLLIAYWGDGDRYGWLLSVSALKL